MAPDRCLSRVVWPAGLAQAGPVNMVEGPVSDLVDKVTKAIRNAEGGVYDGGPYAPNSPIAQAHAAIKAVLDDLEQRAPDHVDTAFITELRRDLGLTE